MIWKTIPRFPGYEFSEDGQVRSLDRIQNGPRGGKGIVRGKLMRQQLNETRKHAYYKLDLCVDKKRISCWVHRLICEAFHGPPPDPKSEAMHAHDNGLDSRASELSWGTRVQNERNKSRYDQLEDARFIDLEAQAVGSGIQDGEFF